jgi:sugar O-acyltransferase (sialic acid O-acetyltransferase NeuD family)
MGDFVSQGKEVKNVFVFGAGGHAKVIIDAIEKLGHYNIDFLADDELLLKDTEVYGYRVIGGRHAVPSGAPRRGGIVAVGDNHLRAEIAVWLADRGFPLINVIHPSVQMARGVKLGEDIVLMAGAIINSDTSLGDNVIVNTGSTIDHDCVVEESTHIAPGCHVCGSVRIGAFSMIGAGTTIIRGVSVGSNCIVGAGSVLINDIPDGMVAMGNPARPVRAV